jgi:dihydroorotase
MKLLIHGARLVSTADGLDDMLDLLIENGKIAAIGKDLSAAAPDRTADASGLTLTAGLIDLFAKANEPAAEGFEDLLSAAKAGVAVCGLRPLSLGLRRQRQGPAALRRAAACGGEGRL